MAAKANTTFSTTPIRTTVGEFNKVFIFGAIGRGIMKKGITNKGVSHKASAVTTVLETPFASAIDEQVHTPKKYIPMNRYSYIIVHSFAGWRDGWRLGRGARARSTFLSLRKTRDGLRENPGIQRNPGTDYR
jgi:hypothetical protein